MFLHFHFSSQEYIAQPHAKSWPYLQHFIEAQRGVYAEMENYLLQLTEPLRPFLNEGLSHDSRLTLLGAAADWTIWIPVEEEIGHENLFFPGEFINQWRKKFLVEVLPCFQKGFTELTIGEPHELACEPARRVMLFSPRTFVNGGVGF
ncbi:MAG: hypothetical protein ABR928_10000, partial [Terracidiphilus sp.]